MSADIGRTKKNAPGREAERALRSGSRSRYGDVQPWTVISWIDHQLVVPVGCMPVW
jgi:hypothetical protein